MYIGDLSKLLCKYVLLSEYTYFLNIDTEIFNFRVIWHINCKLIEVSRLFSTVATPENITTAAGHNLFLTTSTAAQMVPTIFFSDVRSALVSHLSTCLGFSS